MAEVDDLIRGALGRMTVDVDIAAAQRAVRSRIASGEVGPRMEIAPGWRAARWGWSAHRAAWTSFIVVLAAVALLVTWGLGGFASPNEPTPGMTPPAPVTGRSTTSATVGTTTVDSSTAPTASSSEPASTSALSSAAPSSSATLTASLPVTSPVLTSAVPSSSMPSTPVRPTPRSTPTPTTAVPTTAPTTRAPTATSNAPSTTAPKTTKPTTTPTTTKPTSTEPKGDDEVPTILTAFATSRTVSPGQSVSIVVQATDNVGVVSIQLTWTAESLGLPSGQAPMTPSANGWLWTWTAPDTKQSGPVTFRAIARDAAGHESAPASVSVAVTAGAAAG